MANSKNPNPVELDYYQKLEKYINSSPSNIVEKFKNFTKYVPRQDLTRFLVKYEIFKKILNVSGSIVECGVLHGAGLMSFAHLSSIFEHLNHERKIIGFDTFEGFPDEASIHDNKEYAKKGELAINSYEDLIECAKLYDENRFLNHVPKIDLIKGDILETVPKYLKENPQTVVSLLYLDADLYEPTKVCLENFVPRMPKGSVIVFDEINDKVWPGETTALLNTVGIQNLRLQRFPFDTKVSYAVLE
ncbi:dTDP-6-deoxy-L-hexose 3-O-methyltransferase [Nitrosopumilus sp. b1]|nr:dTDP-6-deoxy-L-hexose 3-O-methyltransferase [Nitrosopumilus sp. b1]